MADAQAGEALPPPPSPTTIKIAVRVLVNK